MIRRNIGIKLKATVLGIPELRINTKNFTKAARREAAKGVGDAARFLKVRSQELVPIDTGELFNSAYSVVFAKGPTGNADEIIGEVGYKAPYAVPVHEILEVFHPNGQAKYLESAAKNNTKTLTGLVKRRINVASLATKVPRIRLPKKGTRFGPHRA